MADNKTSKNLKSYKTSAILFSISGFIFIILSTVSGKVGLFLPIGIALIIVSIVFWQSTRKRHKIFLRQSDFLMNAAETLVYNKYYRQGYVCLKIPKPVFGQALQVLN